MRRKTDQPVMMMPMVPMYSPWGTPNTFASSHTAHILGDPEVVAHCPFCGSGDIVAGGDQTISCSFCNRSFLVMEQPTYNSMPGQPGASTDAVMPGDSGAPGDPMAPGMPGDPAAAPTGPTSTSPSPVNPQTNPDELKKSPPFKFGGSKTAGAFEDGIARIKAETDYRVLLKMMDDNARLMQMAPDKMTELTAQNDAARERITELTAKTAGWRDEQSPFQRAVNVGLMGGSSYTKPGAMLPSWNYNLMSPGPNGVFRSGVSTTDRDEADRWAEALLAEFPQGYGWHKKGADFAALDERAKAIVRTARKDETMFRTASGYRLDEDDFVKHVAFKVDRDFMVRG